MFEPRYVIQVCLGPSLYMCVSVYAYVCVSLCVCVFICACMSMCLHVRAYVCVGVEGWGSVWTLGIHTHTHEAWYSFLQIEYQSCFQEDLSALIQSSPE